MRVTGITTRITGITMRVTGITIYARTGITTREPAGITISLCENWNHYARARITMRELESLRNLKSVIHKTKNHHTRISITLLPISIDQ